MEKAVYKKKEIGNWPEFVANKYADFLYRAYKGEELQPERDKKKITSESIDSDVIYSLEETGSVIGFTAVKLFSELPDAVYVREIAVDLDHRGQGLSSLLRNWMTEELKPKEVLGIAHNPVSVISRAQVFNRLGYTTYWGNLPIFAKLAVISPNEVDELGHKFSKLAFPDLVGKYEFGVLPYTEASIWAEPFNEKCDEPNIKRTLEKVLNFQKANNVPAMATLISLKKAT